MSRLAIKTKEIIECIKHLQAGRYFDGVFIKCLVRKQDISAVGKNEIGYSYLGDRQWTEYHLTIIAEKAFFPTYPETEAKLGDFLAWQNETEKQDVAAAVHK